MPIGFDIGQPTDLRHIAAALAPYATQEAAESDFQRAPQGRDYIIDQYQRLTGDAFSNPFNDIFASKRKMQMAQEEAGGGSGTGVAPLQLGQGSMPSRDMVLQNAQAQGRKYTLAGLAATPENARKRAALLGVAEDYERLFSGNKIPTNPSDPLFGMGAGNKKGLGQSGINPEFLTPQFRTMYERNPEKARGVYEAVTGSSNLQGDIDTKRAQLAEQETSKKKEVTKLVGEGLQREVQGHWTKLEKDQFGVTKRVPLSEYETGIVEHQDPRSVFGDITEDPIDFSQRTPQDIAIHGQLAERIAKEKGIPAWKANREAAKILLGAEAKKNAEAKARGGAPAPTPAAAPNEGIDNYSTAAQYNPNDFGQSIFNAYNLAQNLRTKGRNLVPRAHNALAAFMGGSNFAPLEEETPMVPFDTTSREDIIRNEMLANMARSRVSRGREGFYRH